MGGIKIGVKKDDFLKFSMIAPKIIHHVGGLGRCECFVWSGASKKRFGSKIFFEEKIISREKSQKIIIIFKFLIVSLFFLCPPTPKERSPTIRGHKRGVQVYMYSTAVQWV